MPAIPRERDAMGDDVADIIYGECPAAAHAMLPRQRYDVDKAELAHGAQRAAHAAGRKVLYPISRNGIRHRHGASAIDRTRRQESVPSPAADVSHGRDNNT